MAAAPSVKEQRVVVDPALSLQLWRATGLAPKALNCPRQVFSADPDSEPSTSAPAVDSFVFRVPQLPASAQCFYNGPIDTLPTYGQNSGLGLARRTSRAVPALPPQPLPPHGVKQSRKPGTGKGAPSASTSAGTWYDPQVPPAAVASPSEPEESDPLGVLLGQCPRRLRTRQRKVLRAELVLFWEERTISLRGLQLQRGASNAVSQDQPLEQQDGGSLGGGSTSSGTSFGAQQFDKNGQPLSPSSPLSEWRG
ncbi:hypothetical protein HYH03_016917 [Edaphochlamys debaryana]|uniref:Uncharacterized protein n=1 Tax=Edaphochlamys debaryana TaxID=47281 RepID=A0A836BR47_9CHLO|nr:hypothetical protein HYH03_016917 [Edaphochlamys debaryana]|eukprot:KAG2484273.1 hypothetical protein HYH03_016917 [Edaphochlamys debaryana]